MSYTIRGVVLFCATMFLPTLSVAQTCSTTIAATTLTNRFKIKTNGTVLDTQTGRLWKQCSEGQSSTGCTGSSVQYTRQQALEIAQSVNKTGFAGYKDWRVPTIKELASIMERQCIFPTINLSVFPNTPSDLFWTSEPYAKYTYRAWYSNFAYGYHSYTLNENSRYNVRLVRNCLHTAECTP